MIRKVNGQTEMRAFACLYYKGKTQTEQQWVYNQACTGRDKQEAAGFLRTPEKVLAGQGYDTLIMCGEYTHMVEPPPPPKLALISLGD